MFKSKKLYLAIACALAAMEAKADLAGANPGDLTLIGAQSISKDFYNLGTVTNQGTLANNGLLQNSAGASFYNASSARLDNNATLTN